MYEPEEAKDLLKRKLWEGDNLILYKKKDGAQGVDMTGMSKGYKKQYKRYLKKQKRMGNSQGEHIYLD